jgi:hypothetical protein
MDVWPVIRSAGRQLWEAAVASSLAALSARAGMVEAAGFISGMVITLAAELAVCRIVWRAPVDRYMAGLRLRLRLPRPRPNR